MACQTKISIRLVNTTAPGHVILFFLMAMKAYLDGAVAQALATLTATYAKAAASHEAAPVTLLGATKASAAESDEGRRLAKVKQVFSLMDTDSSGGIAIHEM